MSVPKLRSLAKNMLIIDGKFSKRVITCQLRGGLNSCIIYLYLCVSSIFVFANFENLVRQGCFSHCWCLHTYFLDNCK
jgi:hypothetical protein